MAPKVVITSPPANAEVPSSTTVSVQATDNVGVVRVDLLVDGKVLASKTAAPYDFAVVLQAGAHQLGALAYDLAGNQGQASTTVTVKAGGPAPPPPVTPDAGVAPLPKADGGKGVLPGLFGSPCVALADCTSKLCVDDKGAQGKYCSQRCNQLNPCPTAADCVQATDSSYICALRAASGTPAAPGGPTGGCSLGRVAGGAANLGWLALGIPAALFFLLRRRRR